MRNLKIQLVVAELGRLGVIATPSEGNVPDDVLAYANGRSLPIKIKSQTKGNTKGDIIVKYVNKYLNIELKGDVQTIKGKNEIERDLIFVLVKCRNDLGEYDFYIYEQGVIQDLLLKEHTSFLKKHGGVRPRNPKSMHSKYRLEDLIEYKNNWNLITERLGI